MVGVQLKSQYLPDVATVHNDGLHVRSQYFQLVATVHKDGLQVKSQYLPEVATIHNELLLTLQLKQSSTYFLVVGLQLYDGVNGVV